MATGVEGVGGSAPADARPPATRRFRPVSSFATLALAAALSVLGLAVWLAAGFGGETTSRTVSNVSLSSAPLIAAVACFIRAARTAGRIRCSWALLGSAVLSWGLGQLVWTWYESILGREVPFPSLADVGYLGMPVLTAAGLLLLPVRSQSRAQLCRSVLDGLLIAASLLLISWLLVLGPLIEAGADSPLSLVISLAYPVSDVVTVTIVLFMIALARQNHASPMPLLLVGAGLCTFALSDSGFAYLTMIGAYNSGAVIDIGWFAGFLLIMLAARRPAKPLTEVEHEPVVMRSFGVLLPYLAVVAAVITSMLSFTRHGGADHFVLWARSAIILLLVGRQVLTLLENRSLTRGLEARVADRTARLRASEKRFEALVQHSSDVVTVVDRDANVLYQSESIDRVFGHRAESLTGRPWTSLLAAPAAGRLCEALTVVATRPYGTLTIEIPLAHADGRLCAAEVDDDEPHRRRQRRCDRAQHSRRHRTARVGEPVDARGVPRLADGPGQPGPVQGPGRASAAAARRHHAAGRRAVPRSRRFQGDQRQSGARGR
jgi:PAS domain S-box-containing protein